MSSKSIQLRYYVFTASFQLLVWVPVFYQIQKLVGLSDATIFEIQSTYYLMFALFELPTGWLADRWGNKQALVAAAVALFVANLIPLFAATSSGFLLHYCGIALARSLNSGAGSALMYQAMVADGSSDHYYEVEGKARAISLYARLISWLGAGYLVTLQPLSPYAVSAVFSLLAVGASLTLPQQANPVTRQKVVSADQKRYAILFLTMVQGAGIFVMMRMLLVHLLQPILSIRGIETVWFGVILSTLSAIEAFGAAKTKRLTSKLHIPERIVLVGTTILGFSLWMTKWEWTIVAMVGFALFSLTAGAVAPVQKHMIQVTLADSRHRATWLSFESIVDRLLCAALLLPLGSLLQSGHLETVINVTVISTMALVFASTLTLKRLKANIASK